MTEGHRVTEDWMGTPVETLEDLLRPGLRAVCIGINPAPDSVAAEHYFVDILLGWSTRWSRSGRSSAWPSCSPSVGFGRPAAAERSPSGRELGRSKKSQGRLSAPLARNYLLLSGR